MYEIFLKIKKWKKIIGPAPENWIRMPRGKPQLHSYKHSQMTPEKGWSCPIFCLKFESEPYVVLKTWCTYDPPRKLFCFQCGVQGFHRCTSGMESCTRFLSVLSFFGMVLCLLIDVPRWRWCKDGFRNSRQLSWAWQGLSYLSLNTSKSRTQTTFT